MFANTCASVNPKNTRVSKFYIWNDNEKLADPHLLLVFQQ